MVYTDKLKMCQFNKFKRLIATVGMEYSFSRYTLNKFKELDMSNAETVTVKGVWHTVNTYVKDTTEEATQIKLAKSPAILCLFSGCNLKVNDILNITVNEITTLYKVNDVNNVNDLSILADVSLGVVKNG